jgi:hypothetical protein
MIEYLQYCAAGYETGFFSERNLRSELLADFFIYEENREYFDIAKDYWLGVKPTKKYQRFIEIVLEELRRARATGPGLTLSSRRNSLHNLKQGSKSRMKFAPYIGAAIIGIAFFLLRRQNRSEDWVRGRNSRWTEGVVRARR